MERKVIAVAIGLLATLLPAAVVAKARPAQRGENAACAAAYRHALQREKSAHLREAQEFLKSCAKAACGNFLQHACTAKYTQLESDIPSVVPLVTDEGGAAVTSVEVTVDGRLLASKLDGRALPLDPGKHEFSFSKDGEVFATEKTMILTGQRNRAIPVSLKGPSPENKPAVASAAATPAESPPAPAKAAVMAQREDPDSDKASAPKAHAKSKVPVREAPERTGTSAFAYVFAATGLIGVGGYGVLTYWGRKDNALLAQCSPNCRQASVDHVRLLYLGADVALGVGLVSLAASTWLFASSGGSDAADKPAEEEALTFQLLPTRHGAYASIGGAF